MLLVGGGREGQFEGTMVLVPDVDRVEPVESYESLLHLRTAVPAVPHHSLVPLPSSTCRQDPGVERVKSRGLEGDLLRCASECRSSEAERDERPQLNLSHRLVSSVVGGKKDALDSERRLLFLLPTSSISTTEDMAPLHKALIVTPTAEIRDGYSVYSAIADQEWSGKCSPTSDPSLLAHTSPYQSSARSTEVTS